MLCIITQASSVWICSDLIARSSHLLFYHWGYAKSYKVGLLLKSLILDCPYWQLWLKSRKMIFWISLLRRRRYLSQKWTYPAPLKFFPSLPSACASQMQLHLGGPRWVRCQLSPGASAHLQSHFHWKEAFWLLSSSPGQILISQVR